MHVAHHPSPVGRLTLVVDGDALTGCHFEGHSALAPQGDSRHPVLRAAMKQLDEFFARKRQGFDLPLAPKGTEFQRKVWLALREIPYGVTWSYAQLARRIGDEKATRAVGGANGKNPLPIIVPCHRVIGADGSLTGFGGGVGRKRALLELERAQVKFEL